MVDYLRISFSLYFFSCKKSMVVALHLRGLSLYIYIFTKGIRVGYKYVFVLIFKYIRKHVFVFVSVFAIFKICVLVFDLCIRCI